MNNTFLGGKLTLLVSLLSGKDGGSKSYRGTKEERKGELKKL